MLQGERVRLRAVEREDLRRLYELRRDVELVTFTYGHWQPQPFEGFQKRYEKRLDDDEQSWFVVEADALVIGSIELHGHSRRDATAQLGIAIYDRAYLGKGYGREAIALLLEWAFRNQNYRRIWLDTTANNERAIRSYAACGFVEEGRLRKHYYHDGGYYDAVVMGILRSDWESQP